MSPCQPLTVARPTWRRAVPALLAGAAVTATVLTAGAPAAGAETVVVNKSALVVTMHGEGHGHGMSQYGAQGAALRGLSYKQILAFYYPHTRLATLSNSVIRVKLSDSGRALAVAASPRLRLSAVPGPSLPSTGVSRYRLAAGAKHTVTLQRLASSPGAHWTTVRTGLPNLTAFWRSDGGAVRMFRTDGRSTAYYGAVRAARRSSTNASAGVYAINLVSLEAYTAGVTPREMPASWSRQALAAQAVAARTYGRYGVLHPRNANYDICDTTACQVYGGHAHYGPHGTQTWSDDWQAARDSAGKVLTYGGKTIFAQFSASNGGWTVNGGEPYLVARRDPYDAKGSGDPFLSYTRQVSVSSLAGYYGLTKVTKIVVTKRDGHGTGGGRVLSAWIYGNRGSHATRVATTGDDLNWALGAGTTWFTLRNA